MAAMNGMLAAVQLLVAELNADVNGPDMYNETPLHRAATLGKDDTVELLVQLKANINATDKYNETPMHRAGGCDSCVCCH